MKWRVRFILQQLHPQGSSGFEMDLGMDDPCTVQDQGVGGAEHRAEVPGPGQSSLLGLRCGKMGISIRASSVVQGKELNGAAAAGNADPGLMWGTADNSSQVYRRFDLVQAGLKDDKCSGVRQPGDTWNSKNPLATFRSLSFNL